MRLYQRSMLSFVAVIVLVSALTGFLVTRTIESDQAEDSARELLAGSTLAFDNFNEWKTALWKAVVGLGEVPRIAALISDHDHVAIDTPLAAAVRDLASVSGADFVVLKAGWSRFTQVVPLVAGAASPPDPDAFHIGRNQPYIEATVLPSYPAFVGAVRVAGRLGPGSGDYIDVFIVKIIDENLLRRLNFDPRNRVVVFSGRTASGRRMQPLGTVGADALITRFDRLAAHRAYHTVKAIAQDGTLYDAVVQSSGTVTFGGLAAGDQERTTLFVATYYSLQEYIARLDAIRRTVLTVSLFSALFAILVSFLLSGNITSPVRKLLFAMRRIKGGAYELPEKTPGPRGPSEIRELLVGFEDMAARLKQDREELDRFLAEVLRLKEYNERVIHGIREGIAVLNSELKVEMVNQAFLELFGLHEDEVLGRPLPLPRGIFDEALARRVRSVLSGQGQSASETRRDGRGRAYEIRLYPIPGDEVRCVLIAEDVSEKLLYEQKIYQAEKLASISMLSAGVAHEINNPLASILTHVQFLLDEPGPRNESLVLIESETRRIARIVRELLDFSASPASQGSDDSDPCKVVEDVVRLTRYSLHNDADVVLTCELEACPRVALGEDELKQVLINLIKNSLQALGSGGSITLRVRFAPDRGTAEITVKDTGTGIPHETLPRIFDPFFTTKDSREGTGLGLSVVYGILTKRGASIRVESQVGEGTSVVMDIPARGEG